MKEYILFMLGKDTVFLVPCKEFFEGEKRKQQYLILKDNRKEINGVPNILTNEILWEKDSEGRKFYGYYKKTIYSEIINDLLFLSSQYYDDSFGKEEDKNWLNQAYVYRVDEIIHNSTEFNRIVLNGCINDYFFVLEINDGSPKDESFKNIVDVYKSLVFPTLIN